MVNILDDLNEQFHDLSTQFKIYLGVFAVLNFIFLIALYLTTNENYKIILLTVLATNVCAFTSGMVISTQNAMHNNDTLFIQCLHELEKDPDKSKQDVIDFVNGYKTGKIMRLIKEMKDNKSK